MSYQDWVVTPNVAVLRGNFREVDFPVPQSSLSGNFVDVAFPVPMSSLMPSTKHYRCAAAASHNPPTPASMSGEVVRTNIRRPPYISGAGMGDPVSDFFSNITSTISANPIPSAIGAAVLLLLLTKKKGRR